MPYTRRASLWSYTPPGSYAGQEPVRQVIVKEITTLFDERRFRG